MLTFLFLTFLKAKKLVLITSSGQPRHLLTSMCVS